MTDDHAPTRIARPVWLGGVVQELEFAAAADTTAWRMANAGIGYLGDRAFGGGNQQSQPSDSRLLTV